MKPNDALLDIKTFIQDLRLDAASINPNDKAARTLYRRYHGLLIWHHLGARDEFGDQTRTYLHECVADSSAAYFLTIIGLYKAARASLRCSVENLFRVVVSEAGDDLTDFVDIPSLVKRAKEVSKTSNQNVRIGDLYAIYSELCLTVHSASTEYMSLKVPFELLVKSNSDELNSNYGLLNSSFRIMNDILFVELAHYLHLIDFKNADLLRDAIEAVVKGEAAALRA